MTDIVRSCECCKHYNKNDKEEPCVSCTHNYLDKFSPAKEMTNYERIQSMTVAEMAAFLHKHIDCSKCSCPSCTADFCTNELEKWLRSEVQYDKPRNVGD